MLIAAIPPTTPPAIAPALFEDFGAGVDATIVTAGVAEVVVLCVAPSAVGPLVVVEWDVVLIVLMALEVLLDILDVAAAVCLADDFVVGLTSVVFP